MSHSRQIDPDDAKLVEAGFDAALAPAEALAKLRELRDRTEVSTAAIARALGAVIDAGAAQMLAEMEAGASGPLRREIRRALFRLKQHGIEPVAAVAATPAASTSHADAAEITAMLSPIDFEGARIVWIVKPRMQGGVLRMWALISDSDGLVGAQNTGLTRREMKTEREELERRANVKLVDADWRLADFIACEAYRNTPDARRGQVGNFLMLRAEMISSPPPTELVHPVYAELAAEIESEPSVELLKEPELLEWRLPDTLIKPYVEEINRAGESVIVLNPMHKQERVNAVIDRATAEILSGDNARQNSAAARGYRVLHGARPAPRPGRLGGGRRGAAARRNRRDENSVLPGAGPDAAWHCRGGRGAESGRGAALDHDARRGDARARGSRGAGSAALTAAFSHQL